MARVPMVPEARVRQSASPLNPNPPAGAFGAVGESLGALGKVSGEISEVANRRAEELAVIDNRLAADTAAVDTQQRLNEAITQYKLNFQGKNATQGNLVQAYKDLESIRTQGGEGLIAPAARDMFNSQTRIALAQATTALSTFTAQEQLTSRNNDVDALVANAQREMNASNFGVGVAAISNQAMLKGKINGWTDAEVKNYIAKNVGEAAWSVASNIAPVAPAEAQKFYDANGQWMTPQQRGDIESKIRASSENMLVAEVAQGTLNAVMGNGDEASYLTATAGREGTGDNPYSSAAGHGQFIKDTWLGMMRRPEFADVAKGKNEAELLALRQNKTIADRAMLLYRKDNLNYLNSVGLPANNATAGLAHGYGPGAAEAMLKAAPNTPVESIIGRETARINRVAGMTTGQVIGEFQRRHSNIDNAQAQIAVGYEAIAARIADPRLRDRAQTEYLARYQQANTLQKVATGQAMENLLVHVNAGVTSMEQLQTAYPGALTDIQALSPQGFKQLENAMLAEGNQLTPLRQANYFQVLGLSEAQFKQLDLSTIDLTRSNRTELIKQQRSLAFKDERVKWADQTVTRVLGFEPVKQLIKSRPDLEPDTPQGNYFRGALSVELQDWAANNPGKKITENEAAKMVANLASRTTNVRTFRDFGVFQTKGTVSQGVLPFEITEAREKAIQERFTPIYGRPLTAWEVGQEFQKAMNLVEAASGR